MSSPLRAVAALWLLVTTCDGEFGMQQGRQVSLLDEARAVTGQEEVTAQEETSEKPNLWLQIPTWPCQLSNVLNEDGNHGFSASDLKLLRQPERVPSQCCTTEFARGAESMQHSCISNDGLGEQDAATKEYLEQSGRAWCSGLKVFRLRGCFRMCTSEGIGLLDKVDEEGLGEVMEAAGLRPDAPPEAPHMDPTTWEAPIGRTFLKEFDNIHALFPMLKEYLGSNLGLGGLQQISRPNKQPFNSKFTATPTRLIEKWDTQMGRNRQRADPCNFDIPIYLNVAGFGSAVQNVFNVVMVALQGNLTFALCADGRSHDLWEPFFDSPDLPICRKCNILKKGNEEEVMSLANVWQVLSRSLFNVLACVNVIYVDFLKVRIQRPLTASTALIVVWFFQKYVAHKLYKYTGDVQQYIDSQILRNGLDKPFVGAHVRRGGTY
jgi:hypothetical protein